jgi:hypothetical protein
VYGALDTLGREAKVARRRHVRGGKDRRRGRNGADRFPGFPENTYKDGPKGKRIPYKSCVNPEWAEKNDYAPLADPENFTIFSLEIPDGDLDDEALAMLADDESS